MATDADVIVVGAGHNGLVCAAYLAAAGLDVLVLERRGEVGGCASTVDALGARVNVCNCDHSMIRASRVIEELDLAAHGLRYVEMDPVRHYLTVPAGEAAEGWTIFRDPERTLAGLGLTHPRQVDAYRAYLDATTPVARLLLEVTAITPTPTGVARRLAARRGEGVARLLRLSRMAVGDAVRQWFDSEALAAPVCATGPAVWGLPPGAPGTGLGALGYALAHLAPTGRPVGGSGALTDALGAAVVASGGRVRCHADVVRIDCEGPAVRGVALAGGEELTAPVVVCAADPRQALVGWLTGAPPAAHRMLARWAARSHQEGYESKLDAVVDAPPRYPADDRFRAALGLADRGGETTIITPGLDGIAAAHRAAASGAVADQPIFFANVPDLADPSVAPPGGGHTFSLEVLFTPWQLKGGWDSTVEPARWLEAFARHTQPGWLEGVRRWRAVTPPDYERDFGLRQGHAPSFPGGPLAALAGRDRELTRYRTPVRGLFLTGAGTFPGAGVWGASGRNTARAVEAALQRRPRGRRRRPRGSLEAG
ncbi:NAD(P)/FAD-dependent oxidoreductase [Acidiferrimicrobium sp. IK]|uniref:phytoene desaturase family protein n=1 Tax=Acidiferrimicrobium sp. IK TaxID=2871700 RepID=UPI0021CB809C|nr:NAD(P)/FAD-dependent oxidoreductase [Acidiferrimicrobium sp. IK]MCU4183176.1 NAD(P)/FAD-dependent oxidoreductase [Acidiferrimicrobium sp. IK]